MSHRRALLVFALIALALGAAAIVWARLATQTRGPGAKGPPAVPVSVAPVVVKDVPVRVTAIGNVEPYNSVAVKARVDGQIIQVGFKEGDRVRKGDVLFQIDPRPFQAALAQARANLAKDQAQLTRAQSQDVRYQDLLKQNFISKDAYDQVKTNAQTAEATVQGDEAAVETAKLSLDYCTIRSPIDGYAGRILIQVGNLVKANDVNPLVTLNQIVPVYASFSVPEQELSEIRKHQSAGDLVVQATLATSGRAPVTGRLSFIDNAADMTTGTIKLKAEFANTDTALWPGQFVNVVLTLYQQKNAVVAPSQAIQNGPNGQYVFVVKDDQTVEIRDLKVARAVGEDTVVASGLKPGETVVTTGQLRLAPGVKVIVANGKPV
jgi:multidrug efflux system membrane fusion protein